MTLADIAQRMRSTFGRFADSRRGKNTTSTLVDAALSAFSAFFMPIHCAHCSSRRHANGKVAKTG